LRVAADPDEISQSGLTQAAQQRWLSVAVAVFLHVLVFWGLASSMLLRILDVPDQMSEPRIVALAPRDVLPPPDAETFGPVDAIATLPRFRPRLGAMALQRREGDPALAVWTYLCNRDGSLSEAVRRDCPEFRFGDAALGMNDPLNRSGDIGALLSAETATMSLEEAGRAKGWFKPKTPWPAEGARVKGDTLGLPGHNPFTILPK
jgi:hypothetical protein